MSQREAAMAAFAKSWRAPFAAAFRQGLNGTGFVEGQSVVTKTVPLLPHPRGFPCQMKASAIGRLCGICRRRCVNRHHEKIGE
jgi:hypothetical protein